MNMIKRLTALILAVLLLAFTAGCSVELTENQDKSGFSVNFTPKDPDTEEQTEAPAKQDSKAESKSESKADSKAESKSDAKSGSGADKQSSQTTYTMADVKKLKNTERFAKKTLEHIFDGTINGKGKATGYHYTMVTDSKGKVIDGTRSKVDGNGVFTGKVEVDGVKKNGFSSFFPESWSPQQVVDAINTAYDDALDDPSNPKGSIWIGYSGDLEIDMYLNSDKKITSAFPIYEGD